MVKKIGTLTLAAAILIGEKIAPVPVFADAKNPDTFTYLSIGDIDSLDPAWSYDTASHLVIANVYEYLFEFKGESLKEMEPRLAAKMPSKANGLVSSDGLTYTLPIRKGIVFQDGSPFTPEDVRYTLLRFMLYDRDGGPSSLLLEPILGTGSTREKGKSLPGVFEKISKAVEVQGDAVVIRLAKPFAPFLSILANHCPIVSKTWCVANKEWDGREETWLRASNPKKESSHLYQHMNGTGPFLLERWDKKNKEVVLARNDAYWRKPARLKRVVIKEVNEFATRKLMLQAGDADSIYAPQMMFNQLENLSGVRLTDGLKNLETTTVVFFTLQVNPQANRNIGSGKWDGEGIPPDFFSDLDVRKAFAYAIDYQGYIRDLQRGKGRQAVGFIPEGLTGYNPRQKKYSLDLKKAADHFRLAHQGKAWEKGFKFSVVFNVGSEPARIIGQMIKKNIETLNPKFKVDVQGVQWSTYLEQSQNRKVPIFLGAWLADYPDPHNFAYPFMYSAAYFPGKQGYKNPKADRLVEEAVSTLDPTKRQRLYEQLVQLAYEDVPHVVIADGYRYRTQRTWVKGWAFKPIFPDAPYGDYYYPIYKEGS